MVSVFSWRSPEHAARACTEVHPARNLLQLAWAALRHHPPTHTHTIHTIARNLQGTYESQRVVTFIPPDGEFELMK